MRDLIDREAEIDALHAWFRTGFEEDRWWNSTHVLAVIKGLPSAQPERKMGQWVERWHNNKHVLGDMACSVCGAQMLLTFPRFCPNCGADMRGKQNE